MNPSSFGSRLAGSFLALLLVAPAASAEHDDDEALGFERVPPRLSLVDGEVSFWRSGAGDWAPAHVNTPLVQGDELYSGEESSLEVQIGPRAYLRGGEETQLALTSLEPDYLQLRMTRGVASLDLRSLGASQTFEVDTPSAAFTIERSGYYRIDVDGDSTRFSARRGGYASVTTADGQTASIAPSEQVVINGTDDPVLETYAAPELDGWDRWNYRRTDQQLDALSSRYVPAGVYGVDDLDHYGNWRVVPTYGSVWFPHVAVGWVPYSTGDWIYDPYYGWTWIDAAPWGWAPFHYGRWVHVSGYWGWCPGPRVVRTYYAPALVAFYAGSHLSIGIGTHPFGWVALGWGEPLVPWWGPSHWRSVPRWAGWGGPRIVNNVVVNNTTIVNVKNIHTHAHAGRRGAIVAVDRGDFGRRRIHEARLARFDSGKLRPSFDGAAGARPTPNSVVATDRRGRRPARADLERPVVALRKPERASVHDLEQRRGSRSVEARIPRREPPARVVAAQHEARERAIPKRPPFGRQGDAERAAPPRPPRYDAARGEPERVTRDDRDRDRETRAEPEARHGGRPPRVVENAPEPRPRQPDEMRHEIPREPRHAEARRAPEAASRATEPSQGEYGSARDHGRERQPSGHAPSATPQPELPGEPANRVFRGHRDAPPAASEPSRSSQRHVSGQRNEAPQKSAPAEQQGGGGNPEDGGWGRGRGGHE